MNITGIGLHAHNGVKLIVHLDPTATAICIADPGNYNLSAATIYLPASDYERAKRAVESFNAIMSEPDAKPAEAAE